MGVRGLKRVSFLLRHRNHRQPGTFAEPLERRVMLNAPPATITVPGSSVWVYANPFGDSNRAGSIGNVQAPLGSISGTVFQDSNSNGRFDDPDWPMNNVIVWIDTDNDKFRDGGEPSMTTGWRGDYQFDGLTEGTYNVREEIPLNFVGTSAAVLTPTVSSGNNVTGQDHGNFPLVFNGGTGGDTYSIRRSFPILTSWKSSSIGK